MHYDIGGSGADATTTDSAATLGNTIDGRNVQEMSLVVKNTGGSNSADFQLQGALSDTGDWFNIGSASTVLHGAVAVITLPVQTYYTRYRVTVKATSAGNQTTVQVVGGAARTGRSD